MQHRGRVFIGLCVLAVILVVARRDRAGGVGDRSDVASSTATPPPSPTAAFASPASTLASPASFSSPSVIAASATGSIDARAVLLASLRETRACYESQACDFAQDDPRAYDFAIGRRLARDLGELHRRFGPDAAVAREFLSVEDGFVREEALRMIARLPPSEETLTAVAEHLGLNADPDLAAQTMGVLETYLGGDAEPRVHAIVGVMLSGPHFAAERASLNISNFVNEGSYDGYRAAVLNLPPGSKVARNVRAALTEFARHRAGG